jgi:hypothetical protein
MKKAALYTLLLGLPLFGLAGNPPTGYVHNVYYDGRTKLDVIFGHRAKIAFVVFFSDDRTSSKVKDRDPLEYLIVKPDPTEPGTAYCEGWIEMPDGTKRDLPSSNMAFGYTNGVFLVSAPIDMTTEEFSSYLRSVEKNPPSAVFTVDGLKSFEKKLKAKTSN